MISSHPALHRDYPCFDGLIGVARRDITPPVGIFNKNWGAATHSVSTGNHLDFCVTALCLQGQEGDEGPVFILAVDGSWWRQPSDEYRVRGAVLKALHVPVERLILNLSHTHAGPAICASDAHEPGGHLIAGYLDSMATAAVEACQEALQRLQEASLEWAAGHCDLAVNRDLQEPGTTRFLVGFNPQRHQETPLLVGRVTSARGEVLATIVNYACHPTTLAWQNSLSSPDFVGTMRQVVEGETGGAPCLFLQGFSGDLAPRLQYTGDLKVAEGHGLRLGRAVLATLPDWTPGHRLAFSGVQESGAPLAMWREERRPRCPRLQVFQRFHSPPLRPIPTPETHPELFEQVPAAVKAQIAVRQHRLSAWLGESECVRSPVWCWQLGSMPMVAQEHEVYSRTTRLLWDAAGGPVLTLGLCNGGFAYLVPREYYEKDIYPARQTPFGPGALEGLEQTAISFLRAHKAEFDSIPNE